MAIGKENQLASLILGTRLHNDSEEVVIASEHRPRGALLVGQPGLGKSNLMLRMGVQDAQANYSMVRVDPHDGTDPFLRHCPPHRRKDIVLISLVQDRVPIWPLMNVAHRPEEIQVVADHMIDAWRAMSGEQSIGPRAEEIILFSLLLVAGGDGDELLTPEELQTVLVERSYQLALMQDSRGRDDYWPLRLFWLGKLGSLSPQDWQNAAWSTQNKIAPLLGNPWLRRATSGIAPITGPDIRRAKPAILDDRRLRRVIWVRDGVVLATMEEGPDLITYRVDIGDSMENWLIDGSSGTTVRARAFPRGMEAVFPVDVPDTQDPALRQPGAAELAQYGLHVARYVARRRRRRAWSRRVEFDFSVRGVEAREVIDVADLLDDGKIILVEVPETYGNTVTQTIGTFVLLATVLRGIRSLALPPHRRIPASIYIDEAEQFMSKSMDTAFAQLRKAGVGLTLSIQRLGQLGAEHATLRRAIVDTVGTFIALGPGLGEIADVSRLLGIPEDDLRKLERGQGYVSGLSDKWAREKPVPFRYEEMPPAPAGTSAELRAMSAARYTQTVEQAELGHRARVAAIAAVMQTGDALMAAAKPARNGRKPAAPPAAVGSKADRAVPLPFDSDAPAEIPSW